MNAKNTVFNGEKVMYLSSGLVEVWLVKLEGKNKKSVKNVCILTHNTINTF